MVISAEQKDQNNRMSGVEGGGVLGAQKPQVEEGSWFHSALEAHIPPQGLVMRTSPHPISPRAGSEQAGQTPKIQEVSCTSKMISCSFRGNRRCLRGDFSVPPDLPQHSEGISKRKDKITPFR